MDTRRRVFAFAPHFAGAAGFIRRSAMMIFTDCSGARRMPARKGSLVVASNQQTDQPIVQLTGVSKYFSGVRALDNVDFACRRGSTHAILGENGAGKSTLIKIMSGVLHPDAGALLVNGRPARFSSPAEAAKAGIVCIFQELSLVPVFLPQPETPLWLSLRRDRCFVFPAA